MLTSLIIRSFKHHHQIYHQYDGIFRDFDPYNHFSPLFVKRITEVYWNLKVICSNRDNFKYIEHASVTVYTYTQTYMSAVYSTCLSDKIKPSVIHRHMNAKLVKKTKTTKRKQRRYKSDGYCSEKDINKTNTCLKCWLLLCAWRSY